MKKKGFVMLLALILLSGQMGELVGGQGSAGQAYADMVRMAAVSGGVQTMDIAVTEDTESTMVSTDAKDETLAMALTATEGETLATAPAVTVTEMPTMTPAVTSTEVPTMTPAVTATAAATLTPTPVTAPAAPVISGIQGGTKRVKLYWNKINSADGYNIYYSTSMNGSYSKLKTITSKSIVKYVKTSLLQNQTYYFKMSAYRNNGTGQVESAMSAVCSATTGKVSATSTAAKNYSTNAKMKLPGASPQVPSLSSKF